MAETKTTHDVWIVETNTVYRAVPYTVVIDWVQQGRLLESDMLRPAGKTDWAPLGELSAFAVFLPRPQANRVEDQAEALEPVEVEFAWKKRSDDEDDDVDMIPLIDVSLVLLIFFMMTAAVAGGGNIFSLPWAEYATDLTSGVLWVGIDRDIEHRPQYSIGQGDQPAMPEDRNLTEEQVIEKLDSRLGHGQAVDVTIKGDKQLPFEIISKMTETLEIRRGKGLIRKVLSGVSERQRS
jgi:biopolymer transport protein ExbD